MEAGLVVVALIWGLNFPVMKLGLREIQPMAFNALRFPLAAAAAALMLRAQGRRMLPSPRDWRVVAPLGILGHVLYQACFVSALDLTLSGNAALVLSTAPLWVMLLSVLLRYEKANPMVLAGGATTLVGMALVIVGGPAALGFSLKGDLLMVVSAVIWALYLVLSRPATQRHGALEMTAWTLWAGTPLIVLAGAKDPRPHGLGSRVARRLGFCCVRQRVHDRSRLLPLVPSRRADRTEPGRRLRQRGAGGGAGRGLDMAGRDASDRAGGGGRRHPVGLVDLAAAGTDAGSGAEAETPQRVAKACVNVIRPGLAARAAHGHGGQDEPPDCCLSATSAFLAMDRFSRRAKRAGARPLHSLEDARLNAFAREVASRQRIDCSHQAPKVILHARKPLDPSRIVASRLQVGQVEKRLFDTSDKGVLAIAQTHPPVAEEHLGLHSTKRVAASGVSRTSVRTHPTLATSDTCSGTAPARANADSPVT